MFEQTQKAEVVSIQDPMAKGVMFRKLILLILGIGSAAAVGMIVEQVFQKNLVPIWVVVLCCAAWGCVYLITSFATSWVTASILALLETLMMSIPFMLRMGGFGALAFWVACASVALIGYGTGAARMHNMVHMRVHDIFSASKNSIIIITSVILAFLYGMIRLSNGGFFIQKSDIQAFMRMSDPIVRMVYPGFQSNASINSILDSVISKQKTSGLQGLEGMIPQGIQIPGMSDLIAAAGQGAKASAVGQLGAWFGIKLTGKETLPDILYAWMYGMYQKLKPEVQSMSRNIFIGVVCILLYTTLKLLGFVFDIAFWILFILLRGLRVVRVGTTMVEKETLMI